MADFCLDCVEELWGDQGGRNDLVHNGPGPSWALCEGCGAHAFTNAGRRLCGRPQSDFHGDTDAEGEWIPAWPTPCQRCSELTP